LQQAVPGFPPGYAFTLAHCLLSFVYLIKIHQKMPIYLLNETIRFPDPELADEDGLLAIGGDLSPDRLILAYEKGIFPWFGDESPIMWWSPDPRMVLFPTEFKISKSLSQSIRKKNYQVRFDENFRDVIIGCASSLRKHEQGTWITAEMVEAYCTLFHLGYAHSVETYQEDRLVGGLYGISIGKAFFGESMFFSERDASKVALAALIDRMVDWDFHFLDVQQQTSHLQSLGARPVPRATFLELLKEADNFPTITGKW
jgi:leucyl/phenylalanyl-tRNA---protein transferase